MNSDYRDSILEHTRREVSRKQFYNKPEYRDIDRYLLQIVEEVIRKDLLEFDPIKFGEELRILLLYGNITPLTGEDKEWIKVAPDLYQNIRRPSVFKDGEDNKNAYDINAHKYRIEDVVGYVEYVTNIHGGKSISFPYFPPIESKVLYRERNNYG